jgi:nucleosome binding factor SPN SPT16 subunit
VKAVPKILGYGIGMNAKEESLTIKEDNHKVIEAGMTFNVRLTLTGFASAKKDGGKESNTKNCLMIADTIYVTSEGCEVLTSGISRNFSDISYNLEDEDNVAEEQSTAHNSVQNAAKVAKP